MEPPKRIPVDLLKGISRQSLVATDLTREYLNGGIDLIQEALDHDPAKGVHPFLGWLSQRAVVKSATSRGYLRGALGTLRDRWQPHANYVSDLLVWLRYQRAGRSFPAREADRVAEALKSNATISQVVRGLSRGVQGGILADPLFRLQLVYLAVLGSPNYHNSPLYRDGAPELYSDVDKLWLPLVRSFLTSRGLTLRPGIDEQDLIEILFAVGEGIALRELADPSDSSHHARRMNLQGTAALALIYACTTSGAGPDLDLDTAVDQLASRIPHNDDPKA